MWRAEVFKICEAFRGVLGLRLCKIKVLRLGFQILDVRFFHTHGGRCRYIRIQGVLEFATA